MIKNTSVSSYNRYLAQIGKKQEKPISPRNSQDSRDKSSGAVTKSTQILFIALWRSVLK